MTLLLILFIYLLQLGRPYSGHITIEPLPVTHIVNGDVICNLNTGACYPLVFSPTTEFKDILPGQQVPKGLHISINLETGAKQAKIISDSPNIKELTVSSKLAMHGSNALKQLFDELKNSHTAESQEKVLTHLEDIGSDIDVGVEVSTYAEVILNLIQQPESRKHAGKIIGTACSNNPSAQDNFIVAG